MRFWLRTLGIGFIQLNHHQQSGGEEHDRPTKTVWNHIWSNRLLLWIATRLFVLYVARTYLFICFIYHNFLTSHWCVLRLIVQSISYTNTQQLHIQKIHSSHTIYINLINRWRSLNFSVCVCVKRCVLNIYIFGDGYTQKLMRMGCWQDHRPEHHNHIYILYILHTTQSKKRSFPRVGKTPTAASIFDSRVSARKKQRQATDRSHATNKRIYINRDRRVLLKCWGWTERTICKSLNNIYKNE